MKRNSIITGLALIGLADSLYISLSKYQCEACNTIHNTVWGQPLGFPIAWIGILMYAVILAAIWKYRPRIVMLVSTLGMSGSVILVMAQLLILKQYCVFCLLSAVIISALWVLLFVQEKNWRPARLSWLMPLGTAAAFVILVHIFQPANPLALKESAPLAVQSESFQPAGANEGASPAVAPSQQDASSGTSRSEDAGPGDAAVTRESKSQPPAEATVTEPTDKQGLRFYNEAGHPVVVDVGKEPVLFISSRCDTCTLALRLLVSVPREKRPVIIVTWVPGDSDLALERQNMQKKFQTVQLDSAQVLYDLDGLNPAPTVPRFANFSAK